MFPFKGKVDYFILYSILVSSFVIFFYFFYQQKKTHERSVPVIIVSFAKGFSIHPHIFPIFKVVSEYLMLPFKVKVDYFILNLILASTFVIFLLLFSMNKRRRTNEAENSSFIRMCTCSSVNRNERQTINMLSVLRNRPDISCQSALHFDIYLYFSLNDRLLVISLITSR